MQVEPTGVVADPETGQKRRERDFRFALSLLDALQVDAELRLHLVRQINRLAYGQWVIQGTLIVLVVMIAGAFTYLNERK